MKIGQVTELFKFNFILIHHVRFNGTRMELILESMLIYDLTEQEWN